MTKNNLEKKHAKLSASGSDRWINCAGSVKAESRYKNTSSPYADEGTLAHEIGDRTLKSRMDANIFLDKTLKELKINIKSFKPDHKIDEDMVKNVQEYVDYIRAHEGPNTTLYTEERVDFSNVVPDGFGTMDAAVLDFNTGICHIFDLKYGKGVPVYATDNNQGKMYALGFYNELAFLGVIKSFKIHIVQPRIFNYSSWEISVEELLEFATFVKEKAKLALSDDAPRTPGTKQCQWCKAKGDCKALMKFTEELVRVEFDEFDEAPLQDINIMTKEEMLKVLDNVDLIFNWAKEIELRAYNMLMNGEDFPERKIVEGTSNRVLIETAEKEIVQILGDKESYDKKLIGLGDLEKKLRKKLGKEFSKKVKSSDGEEITITKMDQLTVKPKGKLIMVPESDKRQAVIFQSIAEEFESFDESDDFEE